MIADASQFDMAVTFLSSLYGDIVVGSSAADNFVHFGANDELAGMGGADLFNFNIPTMDGATILDLAEEDRIAISPFTATFVGNGGFTGVVNQYRYYSWRGETFIVADANGDGIGDGTVTIANGAFVLEAATPGSNSLRVTGVKTLDPANNTIDGTAGDDVIEGGAGDDTIDGLGGHDLIDGGADNDTIAGGDGNDELYGGDGDDVIDGGSGMDSIYGERGNDTLTGTGNGGVGQDWIFGGLGDDTITASGGVFNIFGDDIDDDGEDLLEGGNGNDVLSGG